MASPEEIETILKNHITEFPGADGAAKQKDYDNTLPKILAALRLPMEDRRAAAQLAIEAPKQFITMALALIVANGVLFQLGWNTFIRSTYLIWMLCLSSEFLAFLSMYFGQNAINLVSKAGRDIDKRWDLDHRWGRLSISRAKNVQAVTGMLGVLCFVTAVGFAGHMTPLASGKATTIELPGTLKASLPRGIAAIGNWSQLRLDGGNGVRLELGPVPAEQTQSFVIGCE